MESSTRKEIERIYQSLLDAKQDLEGRIQRTSEKQEQQLAELKDLTKRLNNLSMDLYQKQHEEIPRGVEQVVTKVEGKVVSDNPVLTKPVRVDLPDPKPGLTITNESLEKAKKTGLWNPLKRDK